MHVQFHSKPRQFSRELPGNRREPEGFAKDCQNNDVSPCLTPNFTPPKLSELTPPPDEDPKRSSMTRTLLGKRNMLQPDASIQMGFLPDLVMLKAFDALSFRCEVRDSQARTELRMSCTELWRDDMGLK